MVELGVPTVEYTDYTNRQLAAVPLAVLAVALAVIGGWYLATGAPAALGLEFTGGTELRLDPGGMSEAEAREALDGAFSVEPSSVRYVPGDDTFIVTFRSGDVPEGELGDVSSEAEAAGFTVEEESIVSASFGGDSQLLAAGVVGVAFLGMSVLVFALFRTVVPSIAVVISAFSDIVIPLAVMNLVSIELTLGTVAALLMLIGYSVDSDILLNNSVLRRTGDFYESVHRAMRTGVTMTLTSISAMAVMAVVAQLFGIDLLRDVGVILLVGLSADLMNTYLLNVSLLRYYKYEGVR